jgi:hypothetical protein
VLCVDSFYLITHIMWKQMLLPKQVDELVGEQGLETYGDSCVLYSWKRDVPTLLFMRLVFQFLCNF